MKFENIFTAFLLCGFFLLCCKDKQKAPDESLINQEVKEKSNINTDLLIGSWKDQSKSALHFSLFADGSAKSDNMETLLYQTWSVNDDQLELVAKSVGNETSSMDTQVYEIQKLDKNEMVLKRDKQLFYYKKVDTNNEKLAAQEKEVVSGQLIIGNEVSVFKPCGSKKEVWITDKTGKLENLYTELTEGKKPYTPIFAKIEIKDMGKATEGFPAKYEGVYEVVSVLETRNTSGKDCE